MCPTLWSRETMRFKGNKTNWFSKGAVIKCFVVYPFQRMDNLAASFSKKVFFCVPNYIIISPQVTSPRTIKTTSLTRIYIATVCCPWSRSSTSVSGIPVYRSGSSCFSNAPCWFTQKISAIFYIWWAIKLNTAAKAPWAQVHPGHSV